jgi:hypothetical protein
MSLVVAWVLFPLVFILLSAGIGLLVERGTGGRLPSILLIPIGTAGLVAASQLPTYWGWSAELTTPLIVLLALAGIGLGLPRVRAIALDPWALAASAGVFAVFAAPVVLSGAATFAGYTVLGDTSIHFIGADHLVDHGRNFGDLPPSSYEFSLANYYGAGGYPSGGPTAVGALRTLVAEDVAWVFQPFLSLLVATMALCLYALLQPVVAFAPLRALAAFIAAQPALVLAYALQGSVKEIGSVWAVALLASLLPAFAAHPEYGVRRAIPLAVAAAAAVAFVGPAAGVWIAPVALAALAVSLWNRRRQSWPLTVGEAAVFVGLLCLLTLPSLVDLRSYLDVAGGVVTAQNELGNLFGPLDRAQMFGTWLTGDYRAPPTGRNLSLTHAFIAVNGLSAVLGLIWLFRRRALWPGVFVGTSVLGWLYVTNRGSPWADAKALMIVSPAIVLLAMLGPPALYSVGRRVEALVLAAVVAAGVLASNGLAYHDVSLAPRDRLGELEHVGEEIAGEGPTLYTEFEEFGKHFLRRGDPEGSSEGWQRRLGPLRNGQFARQGFSNDLDEFPLDYVRYYRTIVVRRSPAASRPPAPYRRTFSGRFYDVWQRQAGSERSVLEHVSLGGSFQRGARAPCDEVTRLAAQARRGGGRLAYSPVARSSEIQPARSAFPPRWFVDGAEGHILRPRGPGKIEDSTRVPARGTYELWIMGSFARGYDVWVDGRREGQIENHLNGRGQYAYITAAELEPGRHTVSLFRGGGSLVPGDGVLELLGPIVLKPRRSDEYEVRYVDSGQARSLCGRWLDWIEVVS